MPWQLLPSVSTAAILDHAGGNKCRTLRVLSVYSVIPDFIKGKKEKNAKKGKGFICLFVKGA